MWSRKVHCWEGLRLGIVWLTRGAAYLVWSGKICNWECCGEDGGQLLEVWSRRVADRESGQLECSQRPVVRVECSLEDVFRWVAF